MRLLPSLLFLCLLSLAASLPAADRVALIIGNDAYQHARRLNAAVNDATAVAGALEQLDFEVVRVTNAGLDQMMEAMETVKRKAVGADAVLVFFAGHGVESGGVNYLVPVDAVLERELHLKKQTLSLDEILADLKSLNVPARMVLLDCCRNNPIEGRSWLSTRSNGGGLAALSQDTLSEATLVVYAASPGKPALDRVGPNDRHSPFTQALLRELPRPGVHSFEVFGRVEDAVLQATEGGQAPRLFYNGSTQPFRNFRFAMAPLANATQSTQESLANDPQRPANSVTPGMIQDHPPATMSSTPSVADAPPAAAATVPLILPSRGFHNLDELFDDSPYSNFPEDAKRAILKLVQKQLGANNFYINTPDGIPGPDTQKALIAWQQSLRLHVTGKLDDEILSRLGLDNQLLRDTINEITLTEKNKKLSAI